jgi:hypothetical protein
VQSLLVNLNTRQLGGRTGTAATDRQPGWRRRRSWLFAGGAAVVVILALVGFPILQQSLGSSADGATPVSSACTLKQMRKDQAQALLGGGAVIVYERNGGLGCVDELYAIYPDGRITADNGQQQLTKQVTPAEVDHLLQEVDRLGWFTEDFYTTYHKPCGACFSYSTTVSYNGRTKTVDAVDGGTDAPANYWQMSGEILVIVPQFSAPAE